MTDTLRAAWDWFLDENNRAAIFTIGAGAFPGTALEFLGIDESRFSAGATGEVKRRGAEKQREEP